MFKKYVSCNILHVTLSLTPRFNPKEDVSSSTSLKSSVQRHIRTALLAQFPLLSQPAWRPDTGASDPTAAASSPSAATTEATAVTAGPAGVDGDGDGDDGDGDGDEGPSVPAASGKKGKSGGKGKGKKRKGDKEDKASRGGGKDKEDDGDGAAGGEGDEATTNTITLLDDIWPRKESLGLTKCHDRISLYTVNTLPLFFNHFDGPYIPTLRLLHRYPDLLPHVQVDRGAIKFLLAVSVLCCVLLY
jgi:PUA domain protein